MASLRLTTSAWPLVAAVLLVPSARAEEAPALDPRAAASVDAPAPELGTVVRATRRPQTAAAMAPGAAVTVVDAARFAGEAKGAGELLATSPGVAVTDTGGVGRLATVSIRGASAEQVKVLLDGVPLNGAAGGGVDLSSIPPQWISRIEVIRGTEGVHHGTGALGGVVNVVTAPPPRGGTWSAGATAGSFGTYQADAQAGVGGAGWGLLASLAGTHSDGDFTYVWAPTALTRETATRTHDATTLGGALLKGFALLGGGRLDAAAELSGGSRDLPGTPATPTPSDWQRDLRGLASARYRRLGPGGIQLSAGGSARLDRLDLSLQEIGAGAVLRQREVAATGTVGADWCASHGAVSLALEAGTDRLVAAGMDDHARPTYAVIASGEVSGLDGRARLGPGIRLERTGDLQGLSAKLGGALPIAGPVSVRASAGRTYRVPSFTELYLQQGLLLPNPALRPEVGLGGDGAVVVDGRFGAASVGAFAAVYRDLIVYQSASFRRLQPQNLDRSLLRGLEAELASAPWRSAANLSAQAAYTLTDSQVLLGKEGVVGSDVPRKPRHRLYARVAAGGPAADAHVEAQWISRQWLALGRGAPIGDALTFGAGASVALWRAANLRLHVEVRNLLDVRTLTDSYDNPLPGRTVLVTLRAGSRTEKP
jgi:iron complex outermembrane receptor protein